MPDYAALKTALGTTYSGQTDAQILTAVNAATQSQPLYVTTQQVAAYLGTQGILAALVAWAASPPSGAAAAAVTAAKELAVAFQSPALVPGFDMTDPTVASAMQTNLSALVAAGALTSQNQTDILAMASKATSQAALWGWSGPIVENDLVAARAMA